MADNRRKSGGWGDAAEEWAIYIWNERAAGRVPQPPRNLEQLHEQERYGQQRQREIAEENARKHQGQ